MIICLNKIFHFLKKPVTAHPEALADLEDIAKLTTVMNDIALLEEQISKSMNAHGSSVSEQSIELKVENV